MRMKNRKKLPNQLRAAFTAVGFLIAHYIYIAIFRFMKFGKNPTYESHFYLGMFYAMLIAIFYWLLRQAKEEPSYKRMLPIFLLYFAERFFSLGDLLAFEEYGRFRIQALISVPILVLIFRGILFCKNKNKSYAKS